MYWTAPFTREALRQASKASAVVIPGDISYANDDPAKWEAWFEDMEPVLSSRPLVACPGNHEGKDEHTTWEDRNMTEFQDRLPVAWQGINSGSNSPFYHRVHIGGLFLISLK
jgi:predicted MPP superfamily phosphohydrolase